MSGVVRSAADGQVAVDVTPQSAGWEFSGLQVLRLAPGESYALATGGTEALVLALSGSCRVRCGSEELEVAGRPDVFAGPSDFVYVPRDAHAEVVSDDGGRFAVASARCGRTLPFRHQAAVDVPVELRGAGSASRQVHNLCLPGTFEADRLIVCEVLTPAGNWSSYPPHKHDEEREGESVLEEIYYFEVADGPSGPGIGYQRVYGHDGAEIDELAEVRTGDVVLIPHGWHGPSMAAPGYDLYYLNVMAGPGADRAWLISDDPQHAWVRDTWAAQAVDPRLPMGGSR
ncbi:5-deoxy-glucuronate isomerase [Mumia zhuanghuii]|uniref:5-deoxy-glucuronate isomerase n=2 Tax=Mumia TaxID=1546255 RepID=A0ABW1QII8_9ACTN|nr:MULTISPECIES: 5-deoxy-glucuronate isomerase [Mumia]KAA1423511.1 5-deoxy-glucuronate isomerase [Mumia zhuanghuii]